MLRITLPTRKDAPVFVLEGKLAGAWVEELCEVTRPLGRGTHSVFDIENVTYVDPLGEELLLWLNSLGANFIAENLYGKDLCRRLHLRRRASLELACPSSQEPLLSKALLHSQPTNQEGDLDD
jgi:hypothetical protein